LCAGAGLAHNAARNKGAPMKVSILRLVLAVVLGTFVLAWLWEFVFEGWLLPSPGQGDALEPVSHRWKFVFAATAFAAVAAAVPAAFLKRAAAERTAVEVGAERAHRRLRDAIESLSEGFALWDTGDRLVLKNGRFDDLLRPRLPAIKLGTRFVDALTSAVRSGLFPGISDADEKWMAGRLRRHLNPGPSFELALSNGTWLQVTERQTADGGVVSTYADITHLKTAEAAARASEARFHALFEQSPLSIQIFAPDGTSLEVNAAFERLWGISRQRLREIGFNILADPQLARHGVLDHVRRGFAGEVTEIPPVLYDAQSTVGADARPPRWVRAFVYPLKDAAGRVSEVILIHEDITAEKNREETMETAKEEAERANRAKTLFLANMSHELRTPLNTIIGFAEILSSEMFGPIENPDYKQYIRDIHESGRHLLDLINDLLDISRIEAGGVALEERKLDVAQVVNSCCRLVGERASKAGVEVACAVGRDLPALLADQRRVKQVLVNLLANAIKFTPAGGKVEITGSLDPDGGFLFTVRDSGIGIAPEDIETVMSPFGQVDNTLSRKYEGAGLGLPLSRNLMRLHGGELTLESVLGKGTTVTVRFPRERTVKVG
jgi:PAS domain S-box-containing protein